MPRSQQSVDQLTHGAVAACSFGYELSMLQHDWGSVGGSRRKTGNCHRRQIVDVIPHEAHVRKADTSGRRELAERSGLVPTSFHDMLDPHLFRIAVDQRAVFSR